MISSLFPDLSTRNCDCMEWTPGTVYWPEVHMLVVKCAYGHPVTLASYGGWSSVWADFVCDGLMSAVCCTIP